MSGSSRQKGYSLEKRLKGETGLRVFEDGNYFCWQNRGLQTRFAANGHGRGFWEQRKPQTRALTQGDARTEQFDASIATKRNREWAQNGLVGFESREWVNIYRSRGLLVQLGYRSRGLRVQYRGTMRSTHTFTDSYQRSQHPDFQNRWNLSISNPHLIDRSNNRYDQKQTTGGYPPPPMGGEPASARSTHGAERRGGIARLLSQFNFRKTLIRPRDSRSPRESRDLIKGFRNQNSRIIKRYQIPQTSQEWWVPRSNPTLEIHSPGFSPWAPCCTERLATPDGG